MAIIMYIALVVLGNNGQLSLWYSVPSKFIPYQLIFGDRFEPYFWLTDQTRIYVLSDIKDNSFLTVVFFNLFQCFSKAFIKKD